MTYLDTAAREVEADLDAGEIEIPRHGAGGECGRPIRERARKVHLWIA